MTRPSPLVVGNWKMHHGPRRTREFAAAFLPLVRDLGAVDVAIAPPFPSLAAAAEALGGSRVELVAQDAFFEDAGAYTGEVSAPMLREAGCTRVLVGHSERRALFGETDATVRQKVRAARRAGISPIVCVGETLQERETHRALEVVSRQVERALNGLGREPGLPFDAEPEVVFAYEPVWAIGTGRAATEKEIAEAHAFLRRRLQELLGSTGSASRILYGGSVRAENVGAIASLPDVDGCLVGGASLDPAGFALLCRAVAERRAAG